MKPFLVGALVPAIIFSIVMLITPWIGPEYDRYLKWVKSHFEEEMHHCIQWEPNQ